MTHTMFDFGIIHAATRAAYHPEHVGFVLGNGWRAYVDVGTGRFYYDGPRVSHNFYGWDPDIPCPM